MEFDDVITFLQIVNDGSIVQAANNLYVSQGTVSLRLRRLEEELGITLLYRGKGIKKVELTAEGEEFLPIARQWVTLNRQAMNIREKEIVTELRIAANTSSNLILSEYCAYFCDHNPSIRLFLQTEHSYEMHQLIQNQNIDIGFANSLHDFPYVQSEPLWSEKMVLLMHKDNPYLQSEDYRDLDLGREIHATFPREFQNWYHTIFGTGKPFVTIGDISLMESYLLYPKTWAIVNEHMADGLCLKYSRLVKVPFKNTSPPERISYLFRYKGGKPWMEDKIELFIKGMMEYAEYHPALRVFPRTDKTK